jgi:hypothetical protein
VLVLLPTLLVNYKGIAGLKKMQQVRATGILYLSQLNGRDRRAGKSAKVAATLAVQQPGFRRVILA